MKVRIIHRYSPCAGTWYIVQKKVLFWWKDFPLVFHEKYMAEQFVKCQDFKAKPCDDKLEKAYNVVDEKTIYGCPNSCKHLKKGECTYYGTDWRECPIS